MARLKPYKFRKPIQLLQRYDKRFEVFADRGKGSHRMIYHPDINGSPVSYPVRCHGEGDEIGKHYIKDIIRAFNLPVDLL